MTRWHATTAVTLLTIPLALSSCGRREAFSLSREEGRIAKDAAANPAPETETAGDPVEGANTPDGTPEAEGAPNDPNAEGAEGDTDPTQPIEGFLAERAFPEDLATVSAELAQKADPCLGSFGDGRVLILDLKSGWFAGDGGTFFMDMLQPQCPAGEVPALKIDYLHITKGFVETNRDPESDAEPYVLPCMGENSIRLWLNFSDEIGPSTECTVGSLAAYDQIWLLSGDEADELDLRNDSELVNSIVSRLSERVQAGPVGLFFGAGLANTGHANHIANAVLGWQEPLLAPHANLTPGIFPSPRFPSLFEAKPLSPAAAPELQAGEFNGSFVPFVGLPQLFDYGAPNLLLQQSILTGLLDVGPQSFFSQVQECFGDSISSPHVTVVAKDHCGRNVIGVHESEGLRVMTDANLARFYGLQSPMGVLSRVAHFLAPAPMSMP